MKNNLMNRIVEFAIATAFAVLPVSCRELPFETQILSYEGNFLLKIFRQTGDRRYLELCKDISHNVIQYVNTKTNHVQPGNNVGWNAWYNWPKVHVPAGKSVTVTLPFAE